MDLEGVRFVAAAYALAFLVLLVWVAMIGAKIRRLDRDRDTADAGARSGSDT